jgi:FAD:protein FMN transferase
MRLISITTCMGLVAWFPALSTQGSDLFSFSKPEMGSLFQIKLHADNKDAAQRAADAAFARIEAINQIASDYLPESELNRLNKAPANQPVPISADLFALIEKSIATAQLTDGAFDITCTYAVQNWRRAKRQKKLPTAEQTAHAVAMTDWRALVLDAAKRTVTKTKPGLLLDFGGIGKGYAANEALIVLQQHGITRAIVAASGDLAIGDPPPGKPGWDVALRTFEKPEESDRLIHLALHNCGVSTSGDLHQFLEIDGKRWSHIIDPRTGLGLTRRIACTVIAPTAFDSDALDTPMCILGLEKGLKLIETLPGHHARFVVMEGEALSVRKSSTFP